MLPRYYIRAHSLDKGKVWYEHYSVMGAVHCRGDGW